MGNTLLVLAGFVAVVAVMLALTLRGGGQWRRKLDDLLLPIGFTRCEADSERQALTQALSFVNPGHSGRRLLLHLYRREAPDRSHTLYVGDYRFASAGGRTSGASWLVTVLTAPTLALPPMVVHGIPQGSALAGRLARALSGQIEMPGFQPVPTGDAAMDARFQVYLAPGASGQALLPQVLDILGRAADVPSLDARDRWLVLSSAGMIADRMRQVLDSHKLQGQLHLAQQLFDTLRRR